MKKPYPISCDYDGVIHTMKDGYDGPIPQGKPIKDAKWALTQLKTKGFKIVVFTAREELENVAKWLVENDIPFDEVTNTKKPSLAYIDDSAKRFMNNW